MVTHPRQPRFSEMTDADLSQIGGSALRTEGRDEVVTHSERGG